MTITPSEWAEKIASTRISFSGRCLLGVEDEEPTPRVPLAFEVLFFSLRLTYGVAPRLGCCGAVGQRPLSDGITVSGRHIGGREGAAP